MKESRRVRQVRVSYSVYLHILDSGYSGCLTYTKVDYGRQEFFEYALAYDKNLYKMSRPICIDRAREHYFLADTYPEVVGFSLHTSVRDSHFENTTLEAIEEPRHVGLVLSGPFPIIRPSHPTD